MSTVSRTQVIKIFFFNDTHTVVFNNRLNYTKVPINPILKCSIEIILFNHSYLQACVKMFAVTPIGFVLLSTKLRKVTKVTKLVNFRLELWLDFSTQVSVNSI